jgi:dipeptidyl aminopeptidase/acylaminoacyl peptidase
MRLVLAGALCALATVARAAPPLETYGKLPALDLVRLSPSGDRIAFVAVDGDDRKLFIRKTGGDALLVTPVGTTKVFDLEWAGEDHVIVSTSSTFKYRTGGLSTWVAPGRAEIGFVFAADVKSGKVTRLLEGEKSDTFDGAAVTLGSRLIDDRWFEFLRAYNVRMGQFVYKVALDTGHADLVASYQDANGGFLIGTDGSVATHEEYAQLRRTWDLFRGAEGRGLVAERPSDLWTVSAAGFGRTPGTIVVEDMQDQAGGKDGFIEYPMTSGAPATSLFVDPQPDKLVFDPQTHLLLGGVLPGGQGAVFFDPSLQRRYDAVRKAFPGLQVELVSFSTGFGKLVVKTDGGDDPGTYWLVDMTTGKAEDLMPAYPVDAKDVGPTSLFKYRASDGLALEGVLTLPPGSSGKSLPLVVMPHGGPVGFYDRVGFDYWAQAFASRGYAVFQPNYRGSGGYGAGLRQAGFGQFGGKMLSDITDGVAALAAAGVIDPAKVCIAGASYGGYAALAEVTLGAGHWRCAVAVSPVTDPGAIMEYAGDDPNTARGRYNRALFGASFAGSDANARISPLRHADMASAPVLLIHGKDDSTVPFAHSQKMYDALRAAGKLAVLDPMEGEDHNWSHEATRLRILVDSVAFVQKYNPVQ